MLLTNISIIAILLVSMLVQGHPSFDALRIAGVKPDLVFIAVVYFGYSFGSFHGVLTGFISGIFHDAISLSPIGLLAMPKLIIGFLVGMIGRSVIRNNILTNFLLLFAASIVKGVITLLLSMVFHDASISDVANIIVPESFFNAILAPPLFYIYDKIFKNEIDDGGRY